MKTQTKTTSLILALLAALAIFHSPPASAQTGTELKGIRGHFGDPIKDPTILANSARQLVKTGTGASVLDASTGSLVLEGATLDAYETTVTITDPTADRTIVLPNASGTIQLSAAADAANAVTLGSSLILFEGATADAFEGTLTVVDPTADRTWTFPDATGYPILSTGNIEGANGIWGGTGTLVAEGATANGFEATVSFTDPTADNALVVPDQGGTFMLSAAAADAASGLWQAGQDFKYEGTTADGFEGMIRFPAEPTQDNIAAIPDASGFMLLSVTDVHGAHGIWTGNSSFIFEGATADTSETTFAVADATADTTQTLPAPAVSGTIEVLSVQAEAATDTITAGQLYGGLIVNTGAVGAAVYTLPAPVVGMHFRVYLNVAQDVDINPADGTQILALTNATGDAISSAATIGNCIELVAISTTEWVALAVSGTWTDAN